MMNLVLSLHLLAAIAWIGGMLFLSLVFVPVLKREGFHGERRVLFQAVAYRFRVVVWISILIIVLTGFSLLTVLVDSLTNLDSWPTVLKGKLVLVTFLIGLTAAHDFWVGPLVARIKKETILNESFVERFLVTLSPWIARLGLVLALVILFWGISLSRL